jgi:hypothetical protein
MRTKDGLLVYWISIEPRDSVLNYWERGFLGLKERDFSSRDLFLTLGLHSCRKGTGQSNPNLWQAAWNYLLEIEKPFFPELTAYM